MVMIVSRVSWHKMIIKHSWNFAACAYTTLSPRPASKILSYIIALFQHLAPLATGVKNDGASIFFCLCFVLAFLLVFVAKQEIELTVGGAHVSV